LLFYLIPVALFSRCTYQRKWCKSLRCLFIVAALVVSGTAVAHFKLNLNIRIIHVAHHNDGLAVYMRLPMPYLVAHLAGEVREDGNREAAPFTTNALVEGEWMHYVDYEAVAQDALGLGQLAASGHKISSGSSHYVADVIDVRVYQGISQPPFSTLQEAELAFSSGEQETVTPAPFVGDSVVDVLIHYRATRLASSYSLSSSLNPGLEGQEDTANLIVDYTGDAPAVFRVRGLLQEPVVISNSVWKAAKTFVVEGVRHIVSGYDHVLFVVCLVLGATVISTLAWRVTGFTIGHSVTLTLGFFGYVPSAAWFIPLIETGIALSIIMAALMALNSDSTNASSKSGFVLTILIGMLHGLGFSFMLQEILSVTSSNIWMSLLSFNVGVEIGQLAIVLMLWPLLYLVGKHMQHRLMAVKWIIALPCIVVAAVWSGQRLIGLINTI